MTRAVVLSGLLMLGAAGCGVSAAPTGVDATPLGGDAGPDADAEADAETETDASPVPDAEGPRDGGDAASDAATIDDDLSRGRERLLASMSDDICGQWASMSESARAVFLTITHRLFLSRLPDERSALSHVDTLYAVLGGGADGSTCGGIDNNRIFASMDVYLWSHMWAAHEGGRLITDGGDEHWLRTRDIAGPHDPFDASNETGAGVDCVLVVETRDSRPPTGQAHFFRPGTEARITRGDVDIAADPHALEVDLDFDCFHRSNPTCRDFAERYRESYGSYGPSWVPSSCSGS